jgi:ferric-dicitrate binding protein FerR (iron transport regulator)
MGFNAEIVRKYLKGRFSLSDKQIVDDYFENEGFSAELNQVLKEYWEDTKTQEIEKNNDLDGILDRINHQILLQSSSHPNRFVILWRLYSRVAAVLLIPVLLFSIFYSTRKEMKSDTSEWVEIHSPYGARTQFSLPDGSSGWLNSGSIIRYPARFNSERTVKISGEAYFDVIKNPDSPFVVDANQVKIKVLGTSFNVVSYDRDSIFEVVVTSGRVEVSSGEQILTSALLPSERLVLNRFKNSFSQTTVDVHNYTSWKNGKLVFLNDDLNEVVRKISRFYNVDFEMKSNFNRKELFRAILEEESLEEVLRYMKLTMSVDYTIVERKTDQGARLSKRKVIISNATKK